MKYYKIVLGVGIFLNVFRFNGITDEKITGMNTLIILIYLLVKHWGDRK